MSSNILHIIDVITITNIYIFTSIHNILLPLNSNIYIITSIILDVINTDITKPRALFIINCFGVFIIAFSHIL